MSFVPLRGLKHQPQTKLDLARISARCEPGDAPDVRRDRRGIRLDEILPVQVERFRVAPRAEIFRGRVTLHRRLDQPHRPIGSCTNGHRELREKY